MAITYNAVTDSITVTGYTEAIPCNFTDLYNADKAGSLSLHARTGIIGVDGAGVVVDLAERPTDQIVLGGASNDLYITVANWNGTTATIHITGTDRDGTAQTEDIIVTANGNYSTTKWFKTITHTQVTAATVTTFDYNLTQGQWGVIWRQGVNQFRADCKITIGDDSTTTWFSDNRKQITFSDGIVTMNNDTLILVRRYAHFIDGEVISVANKVGRKGCQYYFEESVYDRTFIVYSWEAGDTEVFFYGTAFSAQSKRHRILIDNAVVGRVWNCLFNNLCELGQTCSAVDIYDVSLLYTSVYMIDRPRATLNDVKVIYGVKPLYINNSCTFRNIKTINTISYDISVGGVFNGMASYFIDCELSLWNIRWASVVSGIIYRQYTFNLKVIDTDNNAIGTASVVLKDKDGNVVLSVATNASGIIAEQTISYGYYNQANGNTLQSYSPHTLTIKKAGYQTYQSTFTLDDTVDWIIRLIHSNVCIDQEVML